MNTQSRAWLNSLRVRGEIRFDELMARHCSWRVGGHAACTFTPADLADLQLFLQALPRDEALTWIGLGSNTLVRDGGLSGVVVFTHPGLSTLSLDAEHRVIAEAGVTCAKITKLAEQSGLDGAGFLCGIPGSMGGALAMNAGAYGSAIWDFVETVQTIDHSGVVRERTRDEYRVSYRAVNGPTNEWFIAGRLRFNTAHDQSAVRQSKEFLEQRNATQPTGAASCGSVFKNPPGDFAGRLIESADLKGLRHGGCVVSHKHANFIINDDHATATQLEELIEIIRERVAQKFNITLEPEVRIIGAPREGGAKAIRHA